LTHPHILKNVYFMLHGAVHFWATLDVFLWMGEGTQPPGFEHAISMGVEHERSESGLIQTNE
jgi:hypothetical protein